MEKKIVIGRCDTCGQVFPYVANPPAIISGGPNSESGVRTGGRCNRCNLEFCAEHIELRKWFQTTYEAEQAIAAASPEARDSLSKMPSIQKAAFLQPFVENSYRRVCPRCGNTIDGT